METDNRMTIVIVSCDKYKDVAGYYLYYLKKYWSNCEYPIIIASEEFDHKSDIADTILCGKNVSWTKEAIDAISQTSTPYIFLTVDDLYICERVDTNKIHKIVDFVFENGIKFYDFPKHPRKNKYYSAFNGNKNAERIPKNRAYGVSIGSAIWKREELLHILGDGSRSAWDIENDFSREAALCKDRGYIENYVVDRCTPIIYAHMATAGKWIPSGARKLKKYGNYDMNYGTREFLSKAQCFKMFVYYQFTKICPAKWRRPIKRFLLKIGFKFAIEW